MANFEASLVINAGVEGINEINQLANTIEQTGLDVTELRNASQRLQSTWNSLSTTEQTRQLQSLRNEAERLNNLAQARITLGIDTDDNARQEIQRVTQAYQDLMNSGTLSHQEMARATQLHTQRVNELEQELGRVPLNMETISEQMGKIVASAGGLAYVTKEAMAFETAMSAVKKVVDATPEQIEKLSGQIKQMAIDFGMGTDAIAEIVAQGGQLGIAFDDLPKFTEMASKMSVAFGMTAEEAGDAAAKMANVWSIPIKEVEALGDAINTLGNNTAAKEKEIVDVMNRIGGTAKQFGLATEQAAALGSAFISLGKTPEIAGTAINALLTKLSTASVQSDDFKQALDSIGLSADKLAQDINTNPQQALNNFLGVLKKLDKEQQAVATFKLFGQEYVDDVSALVGGLDTYHKALDLVKDKTANAGAMTKEFEAKMDTTAQSLNKAKASISVLAQNIGEHLLPVIATSAELFTSMATAIAKFADNYPHITQFVTLLVSAKVALMAVNSTMTLMGTIGLTSFGQVATGATTATTAITGTTTATAGLSTALATVAKSAVALTGTFLVSNTIGDWAYENSRAVRTIGDELGRLLAYGDAIFTDRTFADVNEHFKTSAESAKELANATKEAKTAIDEKAEADKKATSEATKQAETNRQLLNDIKLTEGHIQQLTAQLAELETQGQKNTDSYKELAKELQNNKDKLELLTETAKQANLGEAMKSDLEKASKSFEALNLDIKEFETGIDAKTNKALTAFVEVARLAEGDTRKLALAYNAVKDIAGDNEQAQDALLKKLYQVTEGNAQLTQSVIATANAQKEAKTASEQQAEALDKLGISMTAVNQGMSKSGLEMAQNLQTGITAIKEQATSAQSLQTALQQAFNTSLMSANTQQDFIAIRQALDQAGVSGQLTAQQMHLLNVGMQAGADGVRQAKQEIDNQNKALDENTSKTQTNTQSKQSHATASREQAEATEQATQAEQRHAQALEISAGKYSNATANMRQQIVSLQQYGATAEQISNVTATMYQSIAGTHHDFAGLNQAVANVNVGLQQQVENFKNSREKAIAMTHSLSGAEVSSYDLAIAQQALNKATQASINGIIRMDNQTLSGLQNSIDSAKSKIEQTNQAMLDLVHQAKGFGDTLEAELAKLKGDDSVALKLEQNRKLADIEQKIAEARKRNNADEIAQLQRALNLQQQINAEQSRQASERKQKEQQQAIVEKQAIQQSSTNTAKLDTSEIKQSFAELMEKAKKDGKQELLKELADDMKRLAH